MVAPQLREATSNGVHPWFILSDKYSRLGTAFDRVAEHTGIEVLKIPHRLPRANAVCERFLGSVRLECLDHILIFSERQQYREVRDYVAYFSRARPHPVVNQQIPQKIENAHVESPATNKIMPFPELKENDPGRRT